MSKHQHHFTRSKPTASVEICTCGRFRFTEYAGPAIVEQPTAEVVKARLEYLRGEIQAERISYGEIAELQDLAKHIEPGDTELLQWATDTTNL